MFPKGCTWQVLILLRFAGNVSLECRTAIHRRENPACFVRGMVMRGEKYGFIAIFTKNTLMGFLAIISFTKKRWWCAMIPYPRKTRMSQQDNELSTTWSCNKSVHRQVGLLAAEPFERSGTNFVHNTVGAARFTEVKCYYRPVLYGSCMPWDVRPQFTDRGEYIDLRGPLFWKMLYLRYHSKMHLEFRGSK